MTDTTTEARLQREARNTYLGRIEAAGELPTALGLTASCRVEVSYTRDGDYWRAGYFHVVVPSFAPSGHDDIDLARHPATLADEAVSNRLMRDDSIECFEIDEVVAW